MMMVILYQTCYGGFTQDDLYLPLCWCGHIKHVMVDLLSSLLVCPLNLSAVASQKKASFLSLSVSDAATSAYFSMNLL